MTSGNAPRLTWLHREHEALGATFTDFAGWRMPLRYSSDTAEHRAVREGAGVFDLSHMGEIRVSGADAAAAVDKALLTHASAMPVGKARYTLICDSAGGILDDLIVYRLADQEFLIVANAANTNTVAAALAERVQDFEAESRDVSADYALLAIQGPRSLELLEPLTELGSATATSPASTADGARLTDLSYYAGYPARVTGHEVMLARTGYTGELGFELFANPDDAAALWHALLATGASPAGLACRDTLRLEAGMPLYGHELSPDVTPYHANLGRLIKLDKPADFVGRDALENADAPDRLLVGIRAHGRRAPRQGYRLYAPDGERNEIGVVTSGAPSPTLGVPIGMAFVDRAHTEPGQPLELDIRGSIVGAEVVALPHYARDAS